MISCNYTFIRNKQHFSRIDDIKVIEDISKFFNFEKAKSLEERTKESVIQNHYYIDRYP